MRKPTKRFIEWLEEPEERSPNRLEVKGPEELVRLLGELQVTERRADARHGDYWSVYAQPWPRREKGWIDILIHVLHPGSTGARHPIEDLRMMLQNEDGIVWLSQSAANRCGQVWFKMVPVGCYHAIPNREQLYTLGDAQTLRAAAAASLRDEKDHIVLYLEDRRIRVDLEKLASTQRTFLTIRTEEENLANAKIRFGLGGVQETLVLKPARVTGLWKASCELALLFTDAVRCLPPFSVISLRGSS
jgi:hypothetical protein